MADTPHTYFLAVDRQNFRVTRYKDVQGKWVPAQRYRVAVGALGYETPRGLFKITGKALNPDWKMPDSEWVPKEDRGRVIPSSDPRNPLKGAFLSIWDGEDPEAPEAGVGFHGTADLKSLGTAASHGCIRMHPDHAVQLFRLVPVGTSVYII